MANAPEEMDWVVSQRKKKVGFIVPSWNTVIKYECQQIISEGVSVHFTRIAHTDDLEERLLYLIDEMPELAKLLAHAGLDAICFGCTGGGFVRAGFDERGFAGGALMRGHLATVQHS